MIETVKNSSVAKASSADEINASLTKIFDSVEKAIKETERKVTLDCVDKTLNALFDAINDAHIKGSKAKLPDFQKILNSSN